MRRRLLVVGIVAGLLAGATLSSWAAPQVKGGGGVGGTCATANALGKFSAAFTLACSLLTDDGTTLSYTGTGGATIPAASTLTFLGRSKIASSSDGNIRLTPNNTSSSISNLDMGGLSTSPSFSVGAGTISVDTIAAGSFTSFTVVGQVVGKTYATGTRCANTGSPAVCAAAPAGSVVIAAGATAVVVNTTAVTANSQVFAQIDRSLGTLLSVTCDTTSDLTTGSPAITARTAATSFTIAVPAAPAANPLCLSYFIVN